MGGKDNGAQERFVTSLIEWVSQCLCLRRHFGKHNDFLMLLDFQLHGLITAILLQALESALHFRGMGSD